MSSNPFEDHEHCSESSWSDSVKENDLLDFPDGSPTDPEPTLGPTSGISSNTYDRTAMINASPYPGPPPPESEEHRIHQHLTETSSSADIIDSNSASENSNSNARTDLGLTSLRRSHVNLAQPYNAPITLSPRSSISHPRASTFARPIPGQNRYTEAPAGCAPHMGNSHDEITSSIIDREEDSCCSSSSDDDCEKEEGGKHQKIDIETYTSGPISHQDHKQFIISLLDEFLVHHHTEVTGDVPPANPGAVHESESARVIGSQSLHITERFIMGKWLQVFKLHKRASLTLYISALTKSLQGFGCPTHVLDFHLTQVSKGLGHPAVFQVFPSCIFIQFQGSSALFVQTSPGLNMYKLQLVDELCRRVASYALETSPMSHVQGSAQNYVEDLSNIVEKSQQILEVDPNQTEKEDEVAAAATAARSPGMVNTSRRPSTANKNLPRQVSALKRKLSINTGGGSKMSLTESLKRPTSAAIVVNHLVNFSTLSSNLTPSRTGSAAAASSSSSIRKDDFQHKRYERILGKARGAGGLRDESAKKLIQGSPDISKSNKLDKLDHISDTHRDDEEGGEEGQHHVLNMADRIDEPKTRDPHAAAFAYIAVQDALQNLDTIIALPPLYPMWTQCLANGTSAAGCAATRNMVSGTSRLFYGLTITAILGFGLDLGQAIPSVILGISKYPPTLESGPGLKGELPITCQPIGESLKLVLFLPTTLAMNIGINAHWRQLPGMVATALLAFTVSKLSSVYLGPQLASACAAFCAGSFGNIYGKITRVPAIVPVLAAMLMLVPGAMAVRSITMMITSSQVTDGVGLVMNVFTVALSLGIGLFMAGLVFVPIESWNTYLSHRHKRVENASGLEDLHF
ncbi:hypothetical protein HDV05_006520 [Chytridiales sp. JEL 0842]|nr:hypothetical protein HDV05_006520 [Chytridiales sp. JEL 0842]